MKNTLFPPHVRFGSKTLLLVLKMRKDVKICKSAENQAKNTKNVHMYSEQEYIKQN